MDFTDRIESFERETATWERLAAEAEAQGKPNTQQHHLGIALADKQLGEFLSTINQDNPTSQARKLYAWIVDCTEDTGLVKKIPGKSDSFHTGYCISLLAQLRHLDSYTLTKLHEEVKGIDARSTERQAWLKGEN